MLQNNLGRWTIQSMRWIGVVILIIGIASLIFGIVLLAAANIAHDEEVEQLKMELQPTTIGELQDLREMIRDNRYNQIKPEDVRNFMTSYLTALYMKTINPTDGPSTTEDMKWETWNSLLLQEKGISVALENLGTAQMVTYAGIGAVILSIGVMVIGLLVIGLGPVINRMRISMAELNTSS